MRAKLLHQLLPDEGLLGTGDVADPLQRLQLPKPLHQEAGDPVAGPAGLLRLELVLHFGVPWQPLLLHSAAAEGVEVEGALPKGFPRCFDRAAAHGCLPLVLPAPPDLAAPVFNGSVLPTPAGGLRGWSAGLPSDFGGLRRPPAGLPFLANERGQRSGRHPLPVPPLLLQLDPELLHCMRLEPQVPPHSCLAA